MSLFAYLQTVSYGLKGMALPAEGKELRRRVDRIRRDFTALAKPLATASTHLKNLKRKLLDAGSPDYVQNIYGVGYKFTLE